MLSKERLQYIADLNEDLGQPGCESTEAIDELLAEVRELRAENERLRQFLPGNSLGKSIIEMWHEAESDPPPEGSDPIDLVMVYQDPEGRWILAVDERLATHWTYPPSTKQPSTEGE
ncbi:MAG: hypothetical protein AAF581_11045 [Planctomycetota bacterium]